MRPRALLVLGLLLLALAPEARAESGTIVLSPGETGEVEMRHRQYQRVAFSFNTTPETLPVGWNIHYLKEGGVVYERAPANATSFTSTFFPLRAGPYFLQFRNWDEDETVRVGFEWHLPAPVSSTRQASGPDLVLAAFACAGAALVAARRIGRV